MADGDKLVGPVVRAVKILQLIADMNDDVSIKDLAAKSGLAPSTTHRMVNLLGDLGLVSFDEQHKRYGIGPEFFRLSAQVMTKTSFVEIARPFMLQMVMAFDETCVLISYLRTPAAHLGYRGREPAQSAAIPDHALHNAQSALGCDGALGCSVPARRGPRRPARSQ